MMSSLETSTEILVLTLSVLSKVTITRMVQRNTDQVLASSSYGRNDCCKDMLAIIVY